eukprot:ANDGO_02750.mRNA.1 hypothetical protein
MDLSELFSTPPPVSRKHLKRDQPGSEVPALAGTDADADADVSCSHSSPLSSSSRTCANTEWSTPSTSIIHGVQTPSTCSPISNSVPLSLNTAFFSPPVSSEMPPPPPTKVAKTSSKADLNALFLSPTMSSTRSPTAQPENNTGAANERQLFANESKEKEGKGKKSAKAKESKPADTESKVAISCPGDHMLSAELGYFDACMWNVVAKHPKRPLQQDKLLLMAMATSKDCADRVRYCAVGEFVEEPGETKKFRLLAGSSLQSGNGWKKRSQKSTAENKRKTLGGPELFRISPDPEYGNFVLLQNDVTVDSAEDAAKLVLGKVLKWEMFDTHARQSLKNMIQTFSQGARPSAEVFRPFTDKFEQAPPRQRESWYQSYDEEVLESAADPLVKAKERLVALAREYAPGERTLSSLIAEAKRTPQRISSSSSSKAHSQSQRHLQMVDVTVAVLDSSGDLVTEKFARVPIPQLASVSTAFPNIQVGKSFIAYMIQRRDDDEGRIIQVPSMSKRRVADVQGTLPEIVSKCKISGIALEIVE